MVSKAAELPSLHKHAADTAAEDTWLLSDATAIPGTQGIDRCPQSGCKVGPDEFERPTGHVRSFGYQSRIKCHGVDRVSSTAGTAGPLPCILIDRCSTGYGPQFGIFVHWSVAES